LARLRVRRRGACVSRRGSFHQPLWARPGHRRGQRRRKIWPRTIMGPGGYDRFGMGRPRGDQRRPGERTRLVGTRLIQLLETPETIRKAIAGLERELRKASGVLRSALPLERRPNLGSAAGGRSAPTAAGLGHPASAVGHCSALFPGGVIASIPHPSWVTGASGLGRQARPCVEPAPLQSCRPETAAWGR